MVRAPNGPERRASGDSDWNPDAYLDPWRIVPLSSGDNVLFGFAITHNETGGLSWMVSSQVREIDRRRRRARTASGRRYQLGRQIEPEGIPVEGQEPWVAFELLVGDSAADGEAVPAIVADRGRDVLWVAACKMSRHLHLPAPGRAPAEFEPFIARYMGAYLERRRAGRVV